RRGRRFRGRTELFPEGINRGNASLLLRNLRHSDRAGYVCGLGSDAWNDESVVELEVTG
ncbi:MOG protein, partial [Oreocharis arfaki]|nr:MOG protein [Oreocharis arfaki]